MSKHKPITYGLNLVKDIIVYWQSISEVLFQVAILIFMGVLMAGVGIHLMEKEHLQGSVNKFQ